MIVAGVRNDIKLLESYNQTLCAHKMQNARLTPCIA